jgi:hypothetical protein
MGYIVIDKRMYQGYLVTDVVGINRLTGIPTATIHNWFRQGIKYHWHDRYDFYSDYTEIKSGRRNLNNLKQFKKE